MVELGDILSESMLRVKQEDFQVWSVSNKDGFINPDTRFSKKIASEDTSNYKVVKPGSIAYNPSRINVGSIALNTGNETGCVSPMYVVFDVDRNKISQDYLFSLLKSSEFDNYVQLLAQGAVRTQLRFRDLSKISIPLPPLEIQREIIAELEDYENIINAAQTIVNS